MIAGKTIATTWDTPVLRTDLAVTLITHGDHLAYAPLEELRGKVPFKRASVDGVVRTCETIGGHGFAVLHRRVMALRHVSYLSSGGDCAVRCGIE